MSRSNRVAKKSRLTMTTKKMDEMNFGLEDNRRVVKSEKIQKVEQKKKKKDVH